ncbi:Fic family protein [Belliella kenyensis]|uniref:Fic family protein n=1 Tax=Belliella kenyensis TaxID=1472724 RepID=A0ABV8EMD6_9BACT|nr:Fic/DOC family N-terminal domain-containing protein [Belliella kenyensis]MCH7401538.1 Fic family protein [Belliella kenyensis]MDN3603182.1 Fic/DOC family N-terminal domain-containing protein [Belliella kenyensis]
MAYLINPDRTRPWNNLPELPIEEQYYRDLDIFEQLGEAKAAIARLQGRSAAIPNQGMLINSISLQEAKASSEIENIFTTDDELYKAFSDESIKQGPTKQILHYRESLWQGHQYLQVHQEFDIPYFELVYQTITGMGDGIRKPFAQTYIRQGGSGPNAGKAVYTPPRGEGIIEAKMKNLVAFMNDEHTHKIDPILKMAMGHFQFEAIHPFRDGNGRTGRLFNIHFLTQKGLLDLPILFLSKFILDRKEDYYAFLAGVTQRGAWKDWLLFMLKAVEVTSTDTYLKINDILAAKDSILEIVEKETSISRPELLVEAIFTQPYTKVKHLTDKKIYAENTARQYLNILSEIGIVERREISGAHYYMNLELYRILGQ